MPREIFDKDFAFVPHAEVLSFEEIARLARLFAGLGVKKIRLTGGEPLVRRELHRLGALLAKQAAALAKAGLKRVTVSLDSLDEATFRAINDADCPVTKVIEGIEAAAAAGMAPIKINMVVKRGVNDGHVLAMAERWRGTGH